MARPQARAGSGVSPLFRAHAAIMRRAARIERTVRDRAEDHGVAMPASGLYVLMLLEEKGPLSPSEIGMAVDWTANCAYVIGLMEKKGLLAREVRASDRRFGDCVITEKGREKMRQIVASMEKQS